MVHMEFHLNIVIWMFYRKTGEDQIRNCIRLQAIGNQVAFTLPYNSKFTLLLPFPQDYTAYIPGKSWILLEL